MTLWNSNPRTGASRRMLSMGWRRAVFEQLESRTLLSVGGGFTGGGIQGDYFANATLSGTPSFTRTDVRVDFNWQGQAPGGSTSPNFAAVAATNFSVRWTGQLIPNFSETYTFQTTSDEGVRLYLEPANSGNWTTVINDWTAHTSKVDTGTFTMTAGQTYDIRLEYYDQTDPNAVCELAWSSPSTPQEVVDTASIAGINAVTYQDQIYADAMKGDRTTWSAISPLTATRRRTPTAGR